LSRNLYKKALTSEKTEFNRVLALKKIYLLRAVLLSIFLFSIITGTFVPSANANPYRREFEFEDVTPPADTLPPEIIIHNPQNGSFYPKNFNLTFDVNILETNGDKSIHSIRELYYLCSWNRKENVVSERGFVGNASFSIDLSDIPGGNHSLTIYAVGYASYIVDEKFIDNITIKSFYEKFILTSFATVHFTKDLVPPRISFMSPPNRTYDSSDVELEFAVTEATSKILYCLDGNANQTLTGNLNFTGLSEGAHNVTIYAYDLAGNTGEPKTLNFSVELPEPFPTSLVIVSVSLVIVIAVIGLFVYSRKNRAISKQTST